MPLDRDIGEGIKRLTVDLRDGLTINNQSDPVNFFLFGREWDYPRPGTVILFR